MIAVAVAVAVDGLVASASVVFASAPVQVVELVGAVQVVAAEVGLAEFEPVDVAFVVVVEEVHGPGGMEEAVRRY